MIFYLCLFCHFETGIKPNAHWHNICYHLCILFRHCLECNPHSSNLIFLFWHEVLNLYCLKEIASIKWQVVVKWKEILFNLSTFPILQVSENEWKTSRFQWKNPPVKCVSCGSCLLNSVASMQCFVLFSCCLNIYSPSVCCSRVSVWQRKLTVWFIWKLSLVKCNIGVSQCKTLLLLPSILTELCLIVLSPTNYPPLFRRKISGILIWVCPSVRPSVCLSHFVSVQ